MNFKRVCNIKGLKMTFEHESPFFLDHPVNRAYNNKMYQGGIFICEVELADAEDEMFVPSLLQVRNVDPAATVGLVVGQDCSRSCCFLIFHENCKTKVCFFGQLYGYIIFPIRGNRLLRIRQYQT